MCVRVRARSLNVFFLFVGFFPFTRERTLKNTALFGPTKKERLRTRFYKSAKEGKHVGRRVCGVEKEEEEKQEG